MYGSTDMNVLRTTISPSSGSPTSTSASWKSDGWGSPAGREASLISRLVQVIGRHASPLDLHAVVMEDRAAAHVGVALLDRRVDVGPAAHVLEPMSLGRADHAGPHAVGHLDHREEAAASVEDPRHVAVGQPARDGVVGVHGDPRLARLAPQVGLVG